MRLLVQLSTTGRRPGYRKSFESQNKGKQKTSSSQRGGKRGDFGQSSIKESPSRPSTNFTDRDNIREQYGAQQTQTGRRPGYRKSFESQNKGKQKTSSSQRGGKRGDFGQSSIKESPSRPSTNFTDRDNIREQYGAQQTQTGVVKGGGLRRPAGS